MHVKLIYIGIAFAASIGLIIKLSLTMVKNILAQKQKDFFNQTYKLKEELLEVENVLCRVEEESKIIFARMENISNQIESVLKEQKQHIYQKNQLIIEKYKKDCEKFYIEDVKHIFAVELKQELIKKIVENVSAEMKKTDDLDFVISKITSKYNEYALNQK